MAIGIGLTAYICLTTLIFVNHKKIVQLKKQLENRVYNPLENNTSEKSKTGISQANQKIKRLDENIR